MITIIACVSSVNSAIGRRGQLLYHISADLRRFKAITTGHTLVMGRKTFESLPKGALPNRRNIVVTRNAAFAAPGIETAPSLTDALAMAANDEVFVIGGGEIYSAAMCVADRLMLTMIDDAPGIADADTFFPEVDPQHWDVDLLGPAETDPASGVTYRFIDFVRTPDPSTLV